MITILIIGLVMWTLHASFTPDKKDHQKNRRTNAVNQYIDSLHLFYSNVTVFTSIG